MSFLKTVLIDLSGTLHIDNECTKGAVEALQRLRESNLKIRFVTNTTKESRRLLHERLVNLGFKIEPNEIFTSLWATRDLVARKSLKPMYLVDDKAMEDFEGLTEFEGEPDSVVIGLAPKKFDFLNMNKAFRVLLRSIQKRKENLEKGEIPSDSPLLVAVHESRYYKVSDGGISLGPGAFVKTLTTGAFNDQPKSLVDNSLAICGKPSGEFFRAALLSAPSNEDCGPNPNEAVMIGDDVRDDILGALGIGMKGILVCTGKYRPGDEEEVYNIRSNYRPSEDKPKSRILNDFNLVDDFASAVDLILTTSTETEYHLKE